MPKRLSYLLSVLSLASNSADRDTPQIIRDWITNETSHSGKRRSIIRRDLIHQNGYRGVGAQESFASDLDEALKGNPSGLLSHLPVADHPVILEALPQQKKAPTTAEWLEQQCRENNLHSRLAGSLKRDFNAEEYGECLSFAGLWIARWSAEGAFDKVLAQDGTVRYAVLMKFLKRKHYSAIFVRGAEPLHRLRGARTQHEIRMRSADGGDFMCNDAVEAGEWETAFTSGEDDIAEEVVVSRELNPEEAVSGKEDAAALRRAGASLVRAAHRGNPERYARVFHMVLDGDSREEIAIKEGVSDLRAGHLAGRVRKVIREGELTVDIAAKILSQLAKEPWSTRKEIEQDLSINTVMVKRVLAFLLEEGLLRQAEGESYALTPAADASMM